jgi:vanillate O-demethylase ferredoxin subunit
VEPRARSAARPFGARQSLRPAEIARLDPRGEFYVCGPIGMLEAAKRAWAASGRPVDLLRSKTFGASGEYPPVPFTMKIPRLDREIRVAANQTMLEALEAAGSR